MTTRTSKTDETRPVVVSLATRRAIGARPMAQLLAAVDAGWVDLPADLAAALAAVARCEQLQAEAGRADTTDVRAALVDATVAAIRDGRELPPAGQLLDLDNQNRTQTEHRRVLDAVHAQLLADASRTFDPARILAGHVRPALLRLLDEARVLADEHGDVLALDPAELILDAVKPEILTAWRAFGRHVTGYATLRSAAAALTGRCARDDAGTFAEWTEPPSDPRLFGQSWRGRNMLNGAVPWPTEPRARLLWLVRSGLTVWVPTAAERDARHIEVYPPAAPLSSMGQTIHSLGGDAA